jgi:hypothetical protein
MSRAVKQLTGNWANSDYREIVRLSVRTMFGRVDQAVLEELPFGFKLESKNDPPSSG